MEDLDIIGYSGAPGASANIDLSVPLSGAHSGRRIIEITDVPDDARSEIARESGTDWATELGFELQDDKFGLYNADVYVGGSLLQSYAAGHPLHPAAWKAADACQPRRASAGQRGDVVGGESIDTIRGWLVSYPEVFLSGGSPRPETMVGNSESTEGVVWKFAHVAIS